MRVPHGACMHMRGTHKQRYAHAREGTLKQMQRGTAKQCTSNAASNLIGWFLGLAISKSILRRIPVHSSSDYAWYDPERSPYQTASERPRGAYVVHREGMITKHRNKPHSPIPTRETGHERHQTCDSARVSICSGRAPAKLGD